MVRRAGHRRPVPQPDVRRRRLRAGEPRAAVRPVATTSAGAGTVGDGHGRRPHRPADPGHPDRPRRHRVVGRGDDADARARAAARSSIPEAPVRSTQRTESASTLARSHHPSRLRAHLGRCRGPRHGRLRARGVRPGAHQPGMGQQRRATTCSTFNVLNMLVGHQSVRSSPGRRPGLRRPARAPSEADRRRRRGRRSTGCPTSSRAWTCSIGRSRSVIVDDEYRPSNLVVGETLHAAAGTRRVPAPPGAGEPATGHAPDRARDRHGPARGPVLLQRLPARRGRASDASSCASASSPAPASTTTCARRSSAASANCWASDGYGPDRQGGRGDRGIGRHRCRHLRGARRTRAATSR